LIRDVQSSFDRMVEMGLFKEKVDVASFWTRL
jgi:hypothetical protein